MAAETGTRADAATGEDTPSGRFGRWRGRQGYAALLLPMLLMAVAGVLRFYNLGEPPRIYFDETYYAEDAQQLLRHGVETTFNVHPPVGKWAIAGGIAVFGYEPVGWRAMAALAGTLVVGVTYLAGVRLFRRRGTAALAALLVAVDGLAFTMSRMAMLDVFLSLFVITGFWLLLVDRDEQWAGTPPPGTDPPGLAPPRPRTYRVLAGVAFGLAVATKWSALLAIGAAGLFLIVSEVLWRRRWHGRLLRGLMPAAVSIGLCLVVIPAAVYVFSYTGWFTNPDQTRLGDDLCPDGVCELTTAELTRSWWGEQRAIFRFHDDLEAEHPYRSEAWRWPTLNRPIAFYWESCGAEAEAAGTCAVAPGYVAEIIGLGNPVLWWLVLPAYLVLAWWAVRRRDWPAAAVLLFVFGQFGPWLITGRPLFFFYMTPVVPFMALALAYVAGRLARNHVYAWLPSSLAVVAVAAFAFFYPVLTGLEISYEAWELRMWLGSWI